MRCPNCGGTLAPQDYGITVDECEQCHGIWFARDELRRAKDSSDPNLRWLDFDVFADTAGGSKGNRTCPVCSQPMRSVEYMHSGVKVDVCEQDHGAFLDAGEFQKIMAYLEEVVSEMDVRDLEREAATKLKEVVTGPESRVDEVKDFLAVLRLLRLRASVEHPESENTLARLSHLLP